MILLHKVNEFPFVSIVIRNIEYINHKKGFFFSPGMLKEVSYLNQIQISLKIKISISNKYAKLY